MIMLLIAHITIALSSMVLAGVSMFSPSRGKLSATYALIAGTLVSGTVLVVASSSNLMQSCMTGLAYLAAVGFAAALGHHKLALQETK